MQRTTNRTRLPWLPLAAVVLIGAIALATPVHAEGAKKNLYLFNMDFPPQRLADHPQPAERETLFWQLLDKSLMNNSRIGLTENLENASYRVTLQCTGMRYCSKLKVAIQDTNRNTLATYQIPARPVVGAMSLERVVAHLADTLDEKVAGIERGQIGNFGFIPNRQSPMAEPEATASQTKQQLPVESAPIRQSSHSSDNSEGVNPAVDKPVTQPSLPGYP